MAKAEARGFGRAAVIGTFAEGGGMAGTVTVD